MCVPTSLCKYYQSKAVRQAVDSLIDGLDGKNIPEMNWMETRNYDRALLSAAQVRADFIEFLFKIWEDSFGQADPGRLQGQIFESKFWTPEKIWKDKALGRTYYRNGNPDNGGSSDVLGVWLDKRDRLRLSVNRYDEHEYPVDPSGFDCPKGWKAENCDGADFMGNKRSSSIVELCRGDASKMDEVRKDMATKARTMVEHLLDNLPQ